MDRIQQIISEMLSSEISEIVCFGEELNVACDGVVLFIQNLMKKNDLLVEREKEKARIIKKQEREIKRLRRKIYGPSSDNPAIDRKTTGLDVEDDQQSDRTGNSQSDARNKEAQHSRKSGGKKAKKDWGENVLRIDRFIQTDDEKCPCGCGGTILSYDQNEVASYIPAQYYVEVRKYARYRCIRSGQIISTPFLPKLFKGSNINNRFLAGVAVNKFVWGLPCNRQEQMLEQAGMKLSRSTFNRWLNRVAIEALDPLCEKLVELLFENSERLFMDETPIAMQEPGRGKVGRFYMYCIVSDDRNFSGTNPLITAYFARTTRAKYQIQDILKDYLGLVQTDGYAGYNFVKNRVECWAHSRRHYSDEAILTQSEDAKTAIKFIRKLYKIEEGIKGLSAEARASVRQECSVPILEEFHEWLIKTKEQYLGKSNLVKAINYTLNRWENLTKFVNDGRIDLDTNTVERKFKPIISTRKASLFAGSMDGARAWAIYATLFETCKMHNVDCYKYLVWVLDKIAAKLPRSQYEILLPWKAPDECKIGAKLS